MTDDQRAQAVKERPLLFTPENAQKVHDGIKTQTRRLVKPQPISISWFEHQQGWCAKVRHDTGSAEDMAYVMVPCPHGVPGDRLWVREAWRLSGDAAAKSTTEISPDKAWLYTEHLRYRGEAHAEGIDKWRSSMMMPRWACRTVVELLDVRVERLQKISEEDAKAEGCEGEWVPPGQYSMNGHRAQAVLQFQRLWVSLNGPDSWEQNPWVWVLTFKKVEGTP